MSADSIALLSEAEKLAHLTETISAQFAIELARVLRDLERELARLARQVQDGSRTALSRAVRGAKLRRQIQQALQAAGYPQLARTATSGRLDAIVAQVERVRGAAKLAGFTSTDLARIVTLQTLARRDLFGQGDELSHAVWRTLAQGLFSQRPIETLLEDLADTLDLELSHARTLYDTAINVFARQMEDMKSGADDVYAYVGPVDAVIRPFCRARVGKVFTRTAIDAMSNGQLPNVFLTGGGWNCRHTWHAVSKVSELRELADTDARMPEVTAALQRVHARGRRAA